MFGLCNYQSIADVLSHIKDDDTTKQLLVVMFANKLSFGNEQFDYDQFEKSCKAKIV